MGRYILRRILISIPVMIGITMVTYLIVNLAPGDPISAMLNPETIASQGPDWVAQQKAALGLNDPLPIRYVLWLKQVAQGNLGFSYNDRLPVTGKIRERIWPTTKLMLTVEFIALLVAIPLGVISAVKQYSAIDYIATIFGFTAVSIPSFFLALAAIYLFSVKFGWLPAAGMGTIGSPSSLGDSAKHLVLPAMVLGLSQAAPLIRYTRSSMLETVRQDFMRTARAKGLSEVIVLYRHGLRNALIPLITVVALDLPKLLGGAVIIESVFAWPGMGTLAIEAVRSRDYPVIMAINLLSAVLILVCNLLADVLYAFIDPRIKYS
ncbi:MAG TPA: ABC transporter permease [Nitrolancea sp.]|nr:ABC transporter permease [Nitrolancea sp.]